MRALGCRDFTAYYEHVAADGDERTAMLDCISTNETRFFREPKQFEFLEESVLPQWRAMRRRRPIPKRIRAWSAACSTGEEPYTLAMVLASHFPGREGWSVEILASDLSTRVLDAARDGVWPIERSNDIPERLRKAFMLRGVRSEGGTHARASVAAVDDRVPPHQPQRRPTTASAARSISIFCRNVLIYFNRESKERVIQRLLAPSLAGRPFLPRPLREPRRQLVRHGARRPDGLSPRRRLAMDKRPLRLLVVDDSAVMRQAMIAICRRAAGIEVSVAADPLIAQAKMRERGPT